MRMLGQWLRADSRATDERGWACNLAIFRIVFLAGAVLPHVWLTVRWTERIMPGLPREAWDPVSFYAFLPLDLLTSAPLARTLALATVGLAALGLVGVFTRWTLGLAAVMSLYVLGLPQNQGKVDHYHHLIWFMALLAVGPSARFLSVDAVRAAIRHGARGALEPVLPPGAALSTLRYVWALFGLVYLAPGLAKLERALTSGWASAENLRSILWIQWFERSLYSSGFEPPGRVAGLPGPLLTLAGIAVIGFEVGFVALVFLRPVRPWLAVAGLAFHRGSRLALGIGFGFLTPAYAALVDWAAMGRAITRRVAGGPLVVLYDGDCRLCRRAIALLRSLDLFDGIAPVAADDPRRRRHATLTDDMLGHDLYAVAGEHMAGGYDAYVRIASRIPFLWPLALLMRVPPIAAVGRRLYRRVADARACAVAHPSPAAPGPTPVRRWITALGVGLVIGQATVSGGRLVASITGDAAASPWSRFAWPFDSYPMFTDGKRPDRIVWEPRAVLPDGREIRLAPRAFRRAFGHPAKSSRLTASVMALTDQERQRARSLDLLRSLWSREDPDVRARSVEVRVYAVTYRLGPTGATIVGERLLHRFRIEDLS